MLDVVMVTPPTDLVTDIVPLEEFARHLRLSPTLRSKPDWIANMTEALEEALDKLEGPGGELNRCIRPCTLRRYLSGFPSRNGFIQLPYPDLIQVDAITVEANSEVLATDAYVVGGQMIPEISVVSAWPGITRGARSVSVTYQAGYKDGAYPKKLKRMIKILAAHYIENPEASINEPRQMAVNRATDFGMADLRAALTVPLSYDDWGGL